MKETIKNSLIGAFFILALLLLASMILFIKPRVGDGEKTYQVRFTNISGINKGTRVTYAGKPIGIIVKIEPLPQSRLGPTDALGRAYFYQLTLKVDSSVEIYTTDEVSLLTSGLLGEKAVAIIPKAPPPGVSPLLITDQVIYGNSIDPIENAIREVTVLSDKIDGAVSDFNEWFLENERSLSIAIRSFSKAMCNISETLHTVESEELIHKVAETSSLFNQNLTLTRNALTKIEKDQTVEKFNETVDHLLVVSRSLETDGRQTLSQLNLITKDLADGSGTLGKLIVSNDFYLRLSSLLGRAETVFNDINHYGLLFQYDKSWQRQRTKKANLLKDLQSPQAFRSYFENEVAEIQTSLSRVSILLDKAKDSKERTRILTCDSFQKDFALLLSQITSLSDEIKQYNEDIQLSISDGQNSCP